MNQIVESRMALKIRPHHLVMVVFAELPRSRLDARSMARLTPSSNNDNCFIVAADGTSYIS